MFKLVPCGEEVEKLLSLEYVCPFHLVFLFTSWHFFPFYKSVFGLE